MNDVNIAIKVVKVKGGGENGIFRHPFRLYGLFAELKL